MASKAQTRTVTGVVIAAAVGLGLWLWGGKAKAAAEIEEEEELEDEEEELTEEEKEEGFEPRARAGRVPGKTGTAKYNLSLFPSTQAIQARLTGLAPPYVQAQFADGFEGAVSNFQGDWNFLAEAGMLGPNRLNASRVRQDGVPGPQTLRALEWAIGMIAGPKSMSWPQLLLEPVSSD